MPKTFIQHAETLDVVKNIMQNYPLPDGLIREIIQNSDDAGARRQLLAIDRRRHPTTSLYSADYAEYQQSPALIAYNDALFQDKDWESLEKILKSSKTDVNAFGKFGQGFRSVYHLTDSPQIFSGHTLTLLNLLSADQGLTFDMSNEADAKYTSHITPFQGIPTVPYASSSPPHIPGTIIRLPLRTHASRISNKCRKPDDVLVLFNEFAKSDLDCVLLFLKNIRQIDIWEISSDGSAKEICCSKLRSQGERHSGAGEYETWKVVVEVNNSPDAMVMANTTKMWRMITCPFTDNLFVDALRNLNLSPDLEGEMRQGKLNQRITLATPLSDSNSSYQYWRGGRLFNGLPLPTSEATGWPVHVDARFAVNPSRRQLRQSFAENNVNASFEDKWNPVLFKIFVPQAWTYLLHVLARDDHVQDIFQFWPPAGQTGINASVSRAVPESCGMLQMVFDLVVVAKPAIWPVYVSATPASAGATVSQSVPEFADLGQLKVAKDGEHASELRNALADSRLRFTKPPQHICALIEKSRKFQFLDEKNVHADLLQNVSELERAISTTPRHATVILTYLLKSEDLSLLAGLPLLTNVDGQHVTLRCLPSASKDEKYILHPLFDGFSSPVFTTYDSSAIAVNKLPQSILKIFRTKAPNTLNVVELTPERVKEYLSTDSRWVSGSDPNSTLQSLISSDTIRWLSKFWSWIEAWDPREQFLRMDEVRQMYLVPTQLGLKRLGDPVFDMSITPALAKCLRALGIGLLQGVGATLLSKLGVLRQIRDVRAILQGVSPTLSPSGSGGLGSVGHTTTTSLGLTCADWKALIDHIARSGLDPATLTEEERRKFRLLPIYPLVDPLDTVAQPGPIPENKVVMGVTSIAILPIIEGQVFLDLRGYTSFEILRFLQPLTQHQNSEHYTAPVPLLKLLELAVKNFLSQPPEIKQRIVEYVMKHEREVPRAVLEKLWEMDFIVGRDGVCRRPGEVVDPGSGVGEVLVMAAEVLESGDEDEGKGRFDKYLPRLESDTDKQIIESLTKLPVCPLRRTMDQEMLLGATELISDKKAVDVSRRLLKLLATSPDYGEFVKMIPKRHQWIMTNLGLKAAHECRDRSARRALFDEVFPLVEDGIHMTDVLKGVLGWTDELSHQVLSDQLRLTLEKGGDYSKVYEIIREIGSCPLTKDDLETLRGVLEGRKWVPTREGSLVEPENAVLGQPVNGAEFWEVPFSQAAYPGVVEFLRSMGVAERPMTDAILNRLERFGPGPLSIEKIASVVMLLDILPPDLDDATKSRVFVPDITCTLHPISDVCFNDTRTPSAQLPCSLKPITHDSITHSLALKLGIEPVASGLSKYMGESFITSIQTVIANYNETQLLIEMLANAVDAGAKHFVIVIDEMSTSSEQLMSPGLGVFHQCPALLVYNDAAFTEEDFNGLCNTGVGSKKRQKGTIGQFGRGALTMFHLTELPMIISSGYAVFIDPSRYHLANLPPNANIQQIELGTLRRFYPGHLDFLSNIGGLIDLELEEIAKFSGTLFRLPMRTENHIGHESPISNSLWCTKDLHERILNNFKAVARNCFLFTGLESIQVLRRTREDVVESLWSLNAEPSNPVSDGQFQRRMIQITDDQNLRTLWQTVSFVVPDDYIPEPKAALIAKYDLRHPKAALAAFIRPPGAQYQDYHEKAVLFSTMPLTETTGLPVHCSATFITTNDRRHVRLQLENDPEHQAEYNVWLLTEVIPPLYLYLLELLLTAGVPNEHFWPINDSAGSVDRHIIRALYENHLGNSPRQLFGSTFNSERHLSREEVVILGDRSPIRAVMDVLAPENVSTYSEPFLSRIIDDAGLSPVSPRFLRDEILKDPAKLLQAFLPPGHGQEPQLSTEILEELLRFFLEHDPPQLAGLQLLPLDSGPLATISFADPPSPNIPTYYVWRHNQVPNRMLINPAKLVKLDFAGEMLLGKGFNVEELTSASMALLIEEVIRKTESIDVSQEPEVQAFINDFWDNFHDFRLHVEHIADFPLVPTLISGCYVSLSACMAGRVPVVPILVDNLVCECLTTLGVRIVRRSTPPCPPRLLRILEDRNMFAEFSMRDVLWAMSYLDPHALLPRFRTLDTNAAEAFANWVRTQLLVDVPSELISIARRLPVWSACDQHGMHFNIPADELQLLPEGVEVNVVTPYVPQQRIAVIPQGQMLRPTLARLGARLLSFQDLFVIVMHNLPPAMPTAEERMAYKGLVEIILEHVEDEGLGALLLPNASDFAMGPMNEFYAREDLFVSVFREGSPHFVCNEFEDLEGRLCHIKRIQDMDMSMFADCARSIANDSDEEGAMAAFEVFNHSLPIRLAVLGPAAHNWELIDHVEFIPEYRGELRRPGNVNRNGLEAEGVGLDVSLYRTRPFAEFVAPRDIVRDEYLAIAWSQRTLPAVALSETVIRAHPALGRPSTSEVVEHLRVLATSVAQEHPNDAAILPDLIATYRYLDEKANEARNDLVRLTDERLWLNVDDPYQSTVPWQWESAANLSFDVQDIGNFKFARGFLQDYRRLLLIAGAQVVTHPVSQAGPGVTFEPDHMCGLRRKYDLMRRNRKLVDVEFITQDVIPDEPLLGHRSFLAAHSDHLETMFCSGFAEGGSASSESRIRVPMPDRSRACVAFVLEYIYTNVILHTTDSRVLLDGLDLARYWEMMDLVDVIEDYIIGRRLVNAETVNEIQRIAEEKRASRVVSHCEGFRRDNSEYISRVQGSV